MSIDYSKKDLLDKAGVEIEIKQRDHRELAKRLREFARWLDSPAWKKEYDCGFLYGEDELMGELTDLMTGWMDWVCEKYPLEEW